MDPLTSTWPLFGLRLTTGEVELRLPTGPQPAWNSAEPAQFRRRFLQAQGFAVRRVVTTGSRTGQRHQGQGMGTAMRTAVLASQGVTRARPRLEVQITGLDACRELFGA